MFTGQSFVHAADGAELAAHGAGVLMLRLSVVPDSLCRLRIDGACPLSLPVQLSAGVRHAVVHLPGSADALGDIGSVGRDL